MCKQELHLTATETNNTFSCSLKETEVFLMMILLHKNSENFFYIRWHTKIRTSC